MAENATGKPATKRRTADRTPARRQDTAPAVVALPDGQAALFLDPTELLGLPDPDLAQLAHAFGKGAGGVIKQVRRGCGLLAWAYWHRLDEATYGQWLDDFAELVGVEARTIRGYRDVVAKAENLAIPAVSAARRKEQQQANETKTGSAKNALPLTSPAVSRPKPENPSNQVGISSPSTPPPTPRLTPPIPEAIARLDNEPTPAVLEVRGLVGRLTTTAAETLATCCTSDALRAARERVNEALRVQEEQRNAAVASDRADCKHPQTMWKRLSFGTFCAIDKGGCGVKVR